MSKRRKLVTKCKQPGNNNIQNIDSYLHNKSNNYRKAVSDAFRIMVYKKLAYPLKSSEFDQDLCETLVMRYNLSCVNCKLECEMHEWEALK